MKKGFAPVVIIVVIGAFIVGAMVAGAAFFMFLPGGIPKQPKLDKNLVQTTAQSPQPSLSPNATADWSTYTSTDYKFRYPNASINSNSHNNQDTVTLNLNGETITFEKLVSDGSIAPYRETDIESEVNNIIWKVSNPNETEFCDAGNCGNVLPSYYHFRNGYMYSFIYSASELESTVNQILSTFEFLE